MARDITQSREAERALRDSERRLKDSERFLDLMLENLPLPVFVKDAEELRYVRFNRAAEEAHGYSRDELIGKSDLDVFSREIADGYRETDRLALSRNEPVEVADDRIEAKDGAPRISRSREVAIRDEEGKARYVLGITEDITERRRSEEALGEAKAEAEAANRAKGEFLSRMSHELRTPLNAIIGFGQLLELDELDEGQRESVEQILIGGHHLLELIDEVLETSRIEAGRMRLSLESVDLPGLLSEALSLIAPIAEQAGVHASYEGSEADGPHVLADRQRLLQVLLNLLSNAVKYNQEGGEVHVGCEAGPGDRARIWVQDSGRGMSAEQIELAFEPFERLGADQTTPGTGLGLTLTKQLVEAMGGTIEVASEPGAGSTFSVELERSEEPAATGPEWESRVGEGARSALSGRTLLYVEDNLSNLKLIEGVLAGIDGARLISAIEGRQGIELARRHRPDLVLLDLQLPDIDGIEVIERLRADPATREIQVVVVSADATERTMERLRAAGAAAYVTKPIDVERLLDVVVEQLGVSGGSGVAP